MYKQSTQQNRKGWIVSVYLYKNVNNFLIIDMQLWSVQKLEWICDWVAVKAIIVTRKCHT